MSSPITPVATFQAPLTLDAAETPDDTNWLAILQTHANRQEYNRRIAIVSAFSTWQHVLEGTYASSSFMDALLTKGNFLGAFEVSSGTSTGIDATTDFESLVAQTVGGATTGGYALATDEANDVIICGTGQDGSGYTILRSTDYGANWAVQSTVNTANGYAQITGWNGLLFVNAVREGAGAGGAKIETSNNGASWTGRANPITGPNNDWVRNGEGGFLTDGAGTCVLIPADAAMAEFAWTDNGGTTFSATTGLPSARWAGGAYDAKLGYVAFDSTGANIYQSTDGETWTDHSTATVPTGLTAVRAVASHEGVLLLMYSDGTDTWVVASVDWGVTWPYVLARWDGLAGTTLGMRVTGRRLVLTNDSRGTNRRCMISAAA